MQQSHIPNPLLTALRRQLTRPQWHNLVLLIIAVQLARTLVLRRLALFLLCAITSASCYRRVARLLAATTRTGTQPLARVWVRAVVRVFAPGRGKLPLLIDWTLQRDRCRSLWIMLPVGGRAVALACWLAPPTMGGKGSQRAFEDAALQELATWLPADRPVLLIGDRGFRGADRIRFLQRLGWHYLLRVTPDTQILWTPDTWVPLQQVAPTVGARWQRAAIWLGVTQPLQVNVVAVRAPLLQPKRVRTNKGKATDVLQTETTWFLVTDLPLTNDSVTLYSWRMQIEQTFRDYKDLFGLEQEKTRQPWVRLHALLWAVQIAQALDLQADPAGVPQVPAWPRGTAPLPVAPPAYRSESSTRAGLHQFVVQVLLGTSPFTADLQAIAAKSQRLQQRPQVRDRRRTEPARRHRSRRIPSTAPT